MKFLKFDIDKKCNIKVEYSKTKQNDYKMIGYKIGKIPMTDELCIIKLGCVQQN